MEDKKANLIAILAVICLVLIIIISRVLLNLSEGFFLICGADIAVIFAIFSYLIIRLQYSRSRKLLESRISIEGRELRVEYSFLRKVAGVPINFGYKAIEEATDNFQTLLGKGASASVYKGIISDGTHVAIKRIDGEEHGEKLFRAEVAAIASVQHVNLVRLIGYSTALSGSRFLVYEFISNGSLDHWIFPRKGSGSQPSGSLSWDLRCRVAVDVARALSYLHHGCRLKILHLDIKPENILLDENYRARVSDFGLSRLMGRDESRIITSIKGTKGYMAPEWLLHNGITEKCDVYSYGMVLFEIISGQKSVFMKGEKSKRKWHFFPQIVLEKMREGKLMEVVDPRISAAGNIEEKELRKLVYLALWCIQEKTTMRPSMDHVVEMLEGHVQVQEPPDTQMSIIDLLSIDRRHSEDMMMKSQQVAVPLAAHQVENQSQSCPLSCSISITTLSGR